MRPVPFFAMATLMAMGLLWAAFLMPQVGPAAEDTKSVYTVVAEFPDNVKHPRLLRVVDEETGVICYVFSNDTADIYTGLQCIPIKDTK